MTMAKAKHDLTLPEQSLDIADLDNFEFDNVLVGFLREELPEPIPAA